MSSRDVATLHPKMQELVKAWLAKTEIDPLIYSTVRERYEQAAIFAKGRTADQIASMAARLRALGMEEEAKILDRQAPLPGKRASDSPPGLSFHHAYWLDGAWGGLALDCAPLVHGILDYEAMTKYGDPADHIIDMMEAAESVGLTWGGRWKIRDRPHLQYDKGGQVKILNLARGEYK